MKVLITGGGGFLGKYIVKKLLKDGHEVTNFSRNDYPELKKWGVHCVKGDIAHFDQLNQAMKGFDVCFHVASKVAMWGRWQDFKRTNILGTTNIIKSCQQNGIKKLIYTSTPSVVFGNSDLAGVDEKQSYPKKYYSLYAKSKSIAERMVLDANGKNLATCSLRPHLIWGPGDLSLAPRLVLAAKEKRLKIVGDGNNKVDIIYVENAADAHIKAMEQLAPHSINSGKAYFIGQGPVDLWPFINRLLSIHGVSEISQKIPYKVAYYLGALIEGGLKLTKNYNTDPSMTRFVAMQLSKSHYFNHKNAHNELLWHPKISIDEGIGLYKSHLNQSQDHITI